MKNYLLSSACGALDRIFFRSSNQIPVLMYHSVGESGSRLAIRTRQFEEQMEHLAEKGYKAISPLNIGGNEAKKPIIITFDDGFKDNFKTAYPIMKKFGFTGTIFVSTDHIGGLSAFCRDEADRHHLMLNEEEMRGLKNSGWCIASHFASHMDLIGMDADSVVSEFYKAKQVLEKITGDSDAASIVSYPHSRLDESVVEAVKKAGALMAFNGKNRAYDPARDDKFSIPRIAIIDSADNNKFKLLLSPTFNFLKIHA
jgi:peptidoglycan/xylan/chitin deacetylase (PgdA/CDA1 family)